VPRIGRLDRVRTRKRGIEAPLGVQNRLAPEGVKFLDVIHAEFVDPAQMFLDLPFQVLFHFASLS